MSLDSRFLQESRKIAFQSLTGLGGLMTPAGQKTTSGTNTGNDAFGQIFADIQKTDFSAPGKLPAPSDASKADAPKAADAKDYDHAPVKKADRKDRDDDDRHDVKAADDDKDIHADKTADAKDSGCKKDDAKADTHKTAAKDDDASKSETAAQGTDALTKADAEAPALEQIDAKTNEKTDGLADTKGDAKADAQAGGTAIPAQAKHESAQPLPVAVPLVAQENAAAQSRVAVTAQADGDAQAKSATEEQPLIPVSFRPDPAAGAHTSGKSGKDENAAALTAGADSANANAAAPSVGDTASKGDHTNSNASGQKFQHALNMMQQLGGDTQAQTAPQANTPTQSFSDIANAQAQIHADAKVAARADDVKDTTLNTQPQTSLPAAGTRVIAPMGSTTPSSNGLSGGGTPPFSAQLASQESASSNALNGIGGVRSASIADGGPINLVKSVRDGLPANQLTPTDQVAIQLNKSAKAGNDRFTIQLNPADMGRVDVRMDIAKDGSVRVHVTADNPATYDMLQKDSRGLERALQQAGLQADSNSLSFSLRDGAQNQFAQRQAYGNGFGNGFGGNQGGQNYTGNQQTKPDDALPIYQFKAAPGRVDVRV